MLRRWRWPWVALALCVLTGLAPAAWAKQYSAKRERAVGEKVMKELRGEKQIIEAPELEARVQHVLNELTPFTKRPEVEYEAYILNWDSVNAISIPGGFVCVTKPLLDDVSSDDELAAVLAHEIAHNACYHAMQQLERDREGTKYWIAAVLVGLLAGGAEGAAVMAQAAAWTRQAIFSKYSIEMETEADQEAVSTLFQSSYNPVGLLTFMERLVRATHENILYDIQITDPGVYQTHPDTLWRARRIITQLRELGVPVNRASVAFWDAARARTAFVSGTPGAEVVFLDRVVYAPAGTGADGSDALERAKQGAERLNDAVGIGVQSWEITSETAGDRATVLAAGEPLFDIEPTDAQAQGRPVADLAEDSVTNIKASLIRLTTEWRY